MYSKETESATALFDVLAQQSKEKLSPEANQAVASARQLIDIQCKIASYFVGFWGSSRLPVRKGHRELTPLLFATFHKNILSSYAMLVLTVNGLYGPARAILRSVFEFLMIAKFSDTSENPAVMQRWDNMETVYFTNSVLKKIVKPDPEPFADMWNLLCDFSHATLSSGQVSMKVEENSEQQDFNLAILNALLECNYHLLNSLLITPELAYMAKFYSTRMAKTKRNYDIPDLRKNAHRRFSENRASLSPDSVRLVAAYKRKWTVK